MNSPSSSNRSSSRSSRKGPTPSSSSAQSIPSQPIKIPSSGAPIIKHPQPTYVHIPPPVKIPAFLHESPSVFELTSILQEISVLPAMVSSYLVRGPLLFPAAMAYPFTTHPNWWPMGDNVHAEELVPLLPESEIAKKQPSSSGKLWSVLGRYFDVPQPAVVQLFCKIPRPLPYKYKFHDPLLQTLVSPQLSFRQYLANIYYNLETIHNIDPKNAQMTPLHQYSRLTQLYKDHTVFELEKRKKYLMNLIIPALIRGIKFQKIIQAAQNFETSYTTKRKKR